LRTLRAALGKSQPQFAKMFGISASYVQAIELGQRTLNEELADAIMLRLGVDAESLKRKRGAPVHLIGSGKAEFTLWSGRRDLYHITEHPEHWFTTAEETSRSQAEMDKVVKEYAALNKVTDQRERFRCCVLFWQKRIVLAWKSDQWQVWDVLDNKLRLLFEAAEREHKYHSVAMRLSRWIDNVVREYRLRTTIDVIRNSRSGRDAQWPAFMDTLSPSFRLKPRSRRRRKR
jgi:transcriptional regulator with XRE-family HTH domain